MRRYLWIAALFAHPAALLLAEYAQVNGLRMYYEIHGQGRPLVLLHGGMNTIQTSFARQIGDFTRGGHRVIAIEQMAHGHTADVAGRDLSYEQMAEDTAALLGKLGIARADIVGWSDGGQIALRLAFAHPKLVRHVVASGVGLGPGPAGVKSLTVPGKDYGELFAGWFPDARAEYNRVSPDGAAHWAVVAEKARQMWTRPTWGLTPDEAARIGVPVLIVAGEKEDVEAAKRIAGLIPKSKLYILPGSGHATFRERPELLNPVILDFLDRD